MQEPLEIIGQQDLDLIGSILIAVSGSYCMTRERMIHMVTQHKILLDFACVFPHIQDPRNEKPKAGKKNIKYQDKHIVV